MKSLMIKMEKKCKKAFFLSVKNTYVLAHKVPYALTVKICSGLNQFTYQASKK